FSVQRSAFSVQRSAFSVQRSAFSVQRSAFSVQRSAFYKLVSFSVSGTASHFFPFFSTGVAGGCRPAALDSAVVPSAGGWSAATQMEDRL
ncbi:MAG: hypothetical protein LBK71_06275, partial [Verrucomicrobiales bacterium]|nr:hypothetical protein [Verrucomicrobiales bacterium]